MLSMVMSSLAPGLLQRLAMSCTNFAVIVLRRTSFNLCLLVWATAQVHVTEGIRCSVPHHCGQSICFLFFNMKETSCPIFKQPLPPSGKSGGLTAVEVRTVCLAYAPLVSTSEFVSTVSRRHRELKCKDSKLTQYACILVYF